MKKVLFVLVAALVVLAGVVASRPGTVRVERSVVVQAPPDVLFPLVNDFHAWEGWSPWDKLDAQLERTYSGAPSGVGAVYEWKGKESGSGRMTITQSTPPSRVLIDLDFFEPMEGLDNAAEFTFTPQGPKTQVVWATTLHQNFVGKAFGLVMNMDQMLGGQLETGLGTLKTLAEAEAAKRAQAEQQAAAAAPSPAAGTPAPAAAPSPAPAQ